MNEQVFQNYLQKKFPKNLVSIKIGCNFAPLFASNEA